VLISTAPQGLGDSLQNRLLAPIVLSGLVHRVLRRRRLGTLFTRTLFGTHPDPDLVEFARRIMASAPRQTTIDAAKAVWRFDFRDWLDQVDLPTLVLCGAEDRSVKPEHARTLADGIPQASLQRFRRGRAPGHPRTSPADYSVTSCNRRILMDQATEPISSHHPPSRHEDPRFVRPEWRHLSQGAVRTVDVVMVNVLDQYSLQMPTSQDQHPVQDLTTDRADPPLGVRVRPRRPHRRDEHLDPLRSQDHVEHGGEPGITIADQEPEPGDILTDLHDQVSGLLCDPRPHWMRRHPEHMDPTGRDLDREQDVQPLEQHRVHSEEVHRQHTGGPGSAGTAAR
jgi:hypothetical protein